MSTSRPDPRLPGQPEPPLSAVVVLRPAQGTGFDGWAQVTAANLAELLPEPGAAETAQAHLAAAGFRVEAPSPSGFSITGPRSLFEQVFGGRLTVDEGAGVKAVDGEPARLELPLELLPQAVRKVVQAITFSPPPDFGPTSY